MVEVPAAMPRNVPPDEIVPTAVLLLLHAPPGVGSVMPRGTPEQIEMAPAGEMAPGPAVTVTIAVAEQVPIA